MTTNSLKRELPTLRGGAPSNPTIRSALNLIMAVEKQSRPKILLSPLVQSLTVCLRSKTSPSMRNMSALQQVHLSKPKSLRDLQFMAVVSLDLKLDQFTNVSAQKLQFFSVQGVLASSLTKRWARNLSNFCKNRASRYSATTQSSLAKTKEKTV